MKHIYKRYQWRSPEGIKWTNWFRIKIVEDNELDKVLAYLKESKEYMEKKTKLKEEIGVKTV